jgi:hypothetical protein
MHSAKTLVDGLVAANMLRFSHLSVVEWQLFIARRAWAEPV